MQSRFLATLVVAAFFALGQAHAQTPVTLYATPDNLKLLQNTASYKATPGESSNYFVFGTATLPNQTKISWTFPSGTKLTDLTRLGDGECVTFTKLISGTTNYSTATWTPGAKVVQGGAVIGLAPGTMIATFGSDGRYSGHVACWSRKIDEKTGEVFDQNWITGKDCAKAIGKHTLKIGGTGVNNLENYSVVKIKK